MGSMAELGEPGGPKPPGSSLGEEHFAELKAMLDEDAGKVHSENGAVMTSLRRILTRHAQMLEEARAARCLDCERGTHWAGHGC